jgi:single-strand DNA-binding protein
MASLNKVSLIGHLGQDPEARHLPDGTITAKFSLATSASWKTESGEKKEKTEWHRITAFGKLAQICIDYLAKGRQVYIEGRLQTHKWEKDGQTHYTTEIVAREMIMLGSGKGQTSGQAAGEPQPAEDDVPF